MALTHLFSRPGAGVARKWSTVGSLLGLFLLHALPFLARPTLIGGDEPHYALMAHTIGVLHRFDPEPAYIRVAQGSPLAGAKRAGQDLDRHVLEQNGRTVFSHPLGLPLLAAPLAAAQHALLGEQPPDLVLGLATLGATFAALLIGCHLLGAYLGSSRGGVALGLGLYFSSPLWYYGRTFFTEPWTVSFLAAGLAAARGGRYHLAGIFMALILALKETGVLIVIPFVLAVVALRGWRTSLALLVAPTVFSVLWVAKNLVLVGEPFATFQPFQYGNLGDGASGLLVDPSHGLLWFAPLAVVSAAGWFVSAPPGHETTRLDRVVGRAALGAFVAVFLVTAAWVDWRGGSCYATRLLLPTLVALAIPAARLWRTLGPRARIVVLGLPCAFGFAVNLAAAVDPVPAFWGASAAALASGQPLAFAAGLVLGGTWAVRTFGAWAELPHTPEKAAGIS